MKINVIRGQNQIGGSIIELSTETTRIILDAGKNLNESSAHPYVPPAPGLFSGKAAYDAVFISHYHTDHIGLLGFVVPGIPIYMNKTSYRIARASAESKGRTLNYTVRNLEAYIPVTVGDIKLTPLPCDHSAYGAFMFVIEAEGKTVLYTGDYRSTGRLNFNVLLDNLPHADILLTEGTTISRGPDFKEPSEQELEDFAVETLNGLDGPAFAYLSAQNIDCLITLYNTACKCGRRLILDETSAAFIRAAGMKFDAVTLSDVTNPGDAAGVADVFSSPDFLLCVTPKTLTNIPKLANRISFKNGVLFFARREIYMLKPVTSALISLLKSKGMIVPLLHTSGHADRATIDRLVRHVAPDILIPVHTDEASWFERFEDMCEVIYDCRNHTF